MLLLALTMPAPTQAWAIDRAYANVGEAYQAFEVELLGRARLRRFKADPDRQVHQTRAGSLPLAGVAHEYFRFLG